MLFSRTRATVKRAGGMYGYEESRGQVLHDETERKLVVRVHTLAKKPWLIRNCEIGGREDWFCSFLTVNIALVESDEFREGM